MTALTQELLEVATTRMEHITEMIEALQAAENDGAAEYEGHQYDADTLREIIFESALEVTIRSNWVTPGHERPDKSGEYRLLLETGGPATQIVGDLSEHSEPETAYLEVQDWGIPWTRYVATREESERLLTFAAKFYFDE